MFNHFPWQGIEHEGIKNTYNKLMEIIVVHLNQHVVFQVIKEPSLAKISKSIQDYQLNGRIALITCIKQVNLLISFASITIGYIVHMFFETYF
jgi:hypothetical protein